MWDAFKAVTRGQYISAIKTVRKQDSAELLQQAERECARAHADSPTGGSYESLLEARCSLSIHFTGQARVDMVKRAQAVFAEGDKNWKLLAMLVADYHPLTNIPVIGDQGGRLLSESWDIMQEFVRFFSSLYSLIPSYDPAGLDSLLDELPIPRLSETDMISLEAKIMTKEIEKAIFTFPQNKSPGPDGFPADFYKANVEVLAPRFNLLLDYCHKHDTLPDFMLEAYMVLLLKPGKDPQECASYRPIALLNTDLKILTKILALRLATVLPSIVNIDQTGFMPGKSTDTNLRRLFTHLQIKPGSYSARVVDSIDFEKAFDSVDWRFMFKVLESMGFGPRFWQWVSMLYRCPKVAVQLGPPVSEFFKVGRGTRQGCPLSPFLFAITLEPLAVALRSSKDIRSIRVGTIDETLALYADDMLLFLSDPDTSLKTALGIVNTFATFSGLKVNWGKSSIMPIDPGARGRADPNLPLQWVSSMKYLGVQITSNVQHYMSLNL